MENPMDGVSLLGWSMGWQRIGRDWNDFTFTFMC